MQYIKGCLETIVLEKFHTEVKGTRAGTAIVIQNLLEKLIKH